MSDVSLREAAASVESSARRVFAVASSGGHWTQLLRLLPACDGHELVLVTVDEGLRDSVRCDRFHLVPDASRWSRWRLARLTLRMTRLLVRERPDVVISTGAAPGCVAVVVGKLLGARTVWVDSFANSERMSGSGRAVRRFADLWLTQWPDVAREGGPVFRGSVF